MIGSECPAPESGETVLVAWTTSIRLLTNAEVWRPVLLAFGISAAALGVLMTVISRSPQGMLVALAIFAFLMVLYVMIAVVIDLFGGLAATFALTSLGVRSRAGSGARSASALAFWTGVLAGKPGLAGAGMLAETEQDVAIPYADVTSLRIEPTRRYVHVRGGLVSKPLGLYCTPENYDRVVAILNERCPSAARA